MQLMMLLTAKPVVCQVRLELVVGISFGLVAQKKMIGMVIEITL